MEKTSKTTKGKKASKDTAAADPRDVKAKDLPQALPK